LSDLRIKQWHALGRQAAVASFARAFRGTITANPELFLPVACLFVWQVTALAAKPPAFGFALLLTLLLLIYGYRVLGKTEWLCRLGWVPPRRGFWSYSLITGTAAAGGVWWFARVFHQSLGGVLPPQRILLASFSGPMIEEMLFRGLLFWLIFELFTRRGVPQSAAVAATICLTAIAFAFSHNDRHGLRLYATILTGLAFGWMRVWSGSTAAATLMHATYNLVISLIATLSGA